MHSLKRNNGRSAEPASGGRDKSDAETVCYPGGINENSPTFQRWVSGKSTFKSRRDSWITVCPPWTG